MLSITRARARVSRLSSHQHHDHSRETISIKVLFVRLITVLKWSQFTRFSNRLKRANGAVIRWKESGNKNGWRSHATKKYSIFYATSRCRHLRLVCHCLVHDESKNVRKWIKKFIDFALKLTRTTVIIFIDLHPEPMARLNCHFMW